MIQKHWKTLGGYALAGILAMIAFASDVGLIEPEDVCPPVETEATQ